MFDAGIQKALIAAANRGVQIQVILPTPKKGERDQNAAGANKFQQLGVDVREDEELFIHAKMFVVDGKQAFVGSENMSASSAESKPRGGSTSNGPECFKTLSSLFESDWNDSKSKAA